MPAPRVSFEFFPPADDIMAATLWCTVQRLASLQPTFVSVTSAADAATRARTRHWVGRLLRETALAVAPHLTCIGASRAEVLDLARDYQRLGVRQLVALRGDRPTQLPPGARDLPRADGFAYAADMISGLRQVAPFELSVAAFPEGHPESAGVEADLANLKRKVEAGAARAITQFFFDVDHFLRYRDRCAALGILIPIVPGILPITGFPQLVRFARRCGAGIPPWLYQRFEGLDQDPETRRMIAASVAIEQVQRLRRHGVHEFHFYTLNRAELTYAVCHALGLRARGSEAQVA